MAGAMNAVDLAALVAEVEEARQILAKKAELEHEIAVAEKRAKKLAAEYAAAEHALETTRQMAAQEQARFEHEKARYGTDLRTHVESCEREKKGVQGQTDQEVRQLNADIEAFRARCTTEKRSLTAEILRLGGERDCLLSACAEFKRRIAALPE